MNPRIGRRVSVTGLVILLVGSAALPVAHADSTANLVQVIDTSLWTPFAPGPAGVAYVAATNRLIVVDSDRNNFSSDGVGLWEYSLDSGTVVRSGVLPTNEPTGVEYDPATNTLFVSTDRTPRGIHVIKPGTDSLFGTGDDVSVFIPGGSDPEDPALDTTPGGHLYFLDGATSWVNEIDPVDGIFGNGNDVSLPGYSIAGLGPNDWEGLAYDPTTNHLLAGARVEKKIYEIDKTTGTLVQIVDATGIPGLDKISGLGVSPKSGGGVYYWVADRAVTANNDGKVWQLTTGPIPQTPPVAHDQSVSTSPNTGVAIRLVATDVNGDPLTYEIGTPSPPLTPPAHGVLTGTAPNLTYTPAAGYTGPDSFTFRAYDGTAYSNVATVSITVANRPPVLNPIGNKTVNEGSLLAFTTTATDPDQPANTLVFSLVGTPPAGATITAGGGFTWTPSEAQGPGSYPITFRVTDSGNLFASETITVTVAEVNQPPVVTNPGNQINGEGDSPSFPVAATDPDVPANIKTWTAAGLPPGLSINSSTGQISGTIASGAATASPYAVTVTVNDNGAPNLSATVGFSWTIVSGNHSPILGPIGNKTVTKGSLLTFTATATDPEQPANTLVFSLVGTPPAGATITAGGAFTWTPTGAQGPGNYPITIRVTDSGGLSASETITVTVSEVAPPPPNSPVADTVGLVDPATGKWSLLNSTGMITDFYYGDPGDVPFMGDWDCDGIDTPGLFRQSNAFAYLRNSNTSGIADIRFFFGDPSDIPLAGDFNGDGCDTLSLYRPSTQQFFIINHLGQNEGGLGQADYSFFFGNSGDKPVVGDWDGDGIDEVGLHRASTGLFYYRNTLDSGIASGNIFFGDPADRFVSGDWGIVDGIDTPAIFRPSNLAFLFRHTLTQGNADSQFAWTGASPEWLPVSGKFGLGGTTPTTTTTTMPTTSTFGSGTWLVGIDIPVGTYRNNGWTWGCYWERLSGLGGTLGEIIANRFDEVRQIVEIKSSDVAFSTVAECGTWSNVLTPSKAPSVDFGGGTWLVGSEVAAGVWRNTPAATGCYWERRSGFGGTLSDVISNGFILDMASTLVAISPTDLGFYADADCGTWTYQG